MEVGDSSPVSHGPKASLLRPQFLHQELSEFVLGRRPGAAPWAGQGAGSFTATIIVLSSQLSLGVLRVRASWYCSSSLTKSLSQGPSNLQEGGWWENHIPRPTAALYPLTGWTPVRKINGRVTSGQGLSSVHFPQGAGQSQLALHQSSWAPLEWDSLLQDSPQSQGTRRG